MAIDTKQLIDLLNSDLDLKYTAMIQSVEHAGVLTGAEWMNIQKKLAIHDGEVLQHAITLADQIDYLGGVPTVDVPPAKVCDDNRTMLEQDLEGENDAINRYMARVEQAEDLMLFHLAQKQREPRRGRGTRYRS